MKTAIIGLAIVSGIAMSHHEMANSKNQYDDLLMQNVEALSSDSNEGGFDCALDKDECKFTASTSAEVSILKKIISGGSFTIGAEADLSDATKIYREKHFWECGVRCGTDVTCNDLLRSAGLIQ